jgi:hypothetical protein
MCGATAFSVGTTRIEVINEIAATLIVPVQHARSATPPGPVLGLARRALPLALARPVTGSGRTRRCSAVTICPTGSSPSGCATTLSRGPGARRQLGYAGSALALRGRRARPGCAPRQCHGGVFAGARQRLEEDGAMMLSASSRELAQFIAASCSCARPTRAQLATPPGARVCAQLGSRQRRWQLTPMMTHVRRIHLPFGSARRPELAGGLAGRCACRMVSSPRRRDGSRARPSAPRRFGPAWPAWSRPSAAPAQPWWRPR